MTVLGFASLMSQMRARNFVRSGIRSVMAKRSGPTRDVSMRDGVPGTGWQPLQFPLPGFMKISRPSIAPICAGSAGTAPAPVANTNAIAAIEKSERQRLTINE